MYLEYMKIGIKILFKKYHGLLEKLSLQKENRI